jgi:formylmethanofuran dehydrogenase subunit E
MMQNREMDQNTVVCDECGEEFTSPQELAFHIATVHASINTEGSPYICSKCGEVLRSPADQAEHMKREHPEVVRRINIIYWTILIIVVFIALWRLLA